MEADNPSAQILRWMPSSLPEAPIVSGIPFETTPRLRGRIPVTAVAILPENEEVLSLEFCQRVQAQLKTPIACPPLRYMLMA